MYSKTCVKRSLKKNGFQDQLSLNAGQKYCRILAIPFVIKIFVLSIFEWPFYTGSTVRVVSKDNAWRQIRLPFH